MIGQPGYFYFKDLQLRNRDSAFRINTDGVLLAAWLDIPNFSDILEVGTGTSVISCILARRFPSIQITALEPDENSCREAIYNVKHNKLQDRISVEPHSVQEYLLSHRKRFDHLVSNPPYFESGCLPQSNQLGMSKHTLRLNPKELAAHADRLLSEKGYISVIYPPEQAGRFQNYISTYGFKCSSELRVRSRSEKPVIRHLESYTRKPGVVSKSTEEITLFKDDKRSRTEDYEKLVGGIYSR